jgi:hypothetical protein
MQHRALVIRWTAAALLAGYSFVVARLTLWPAAAEADTFDLLDRIMTRLSGGELDWSETEVLANVALFLPAGFLLAVALGRVWLSVVLCLLASVLIEVAQQRYLPSRVPTVDDVEPNGLGGLIGALAAWPLVTLVRRRDAGLRDGRTSARPRDGRPDAFSR